MITEALRALGDADGIKLLYLAADRLEELEQELEALKAKLKEAIDLAEAAAKTSPYPQTPHFWKRIYDLRHGTNNSK